MPKPPKQPKNRYGMALAKVAGKLATGNPARAFGPLSEALAIVAASGHLAAAPRLLAWIHGERALPASTDPRSGPNVAVVDGFCAAAAIDPSSERTARVQAAELATRNLIAANMVPIPGPFEIATWRDIPPTNPWRVINRWREIQQLSLAPATEKAALAALVGYLHELPREHRGAGAGMELILAIDLALRHDQAHRINGWLATQGHRLELGSLLSLGLTLPAVARAMVAGTFQRLVGLTAVGVGDAIAAIEIALGIQFKQRA